MGEVVQVPKEVLDELAAALWGEDRKSDSPVVLLNSAADELKLGRAFNQPLLALERAIAEVPNGPAAEGPAAVTKATALLRRMLEHLRAIARQAGTAADLDLDVLAARVLDRVGNLRGLEDLRTRELRTLLQRAELSPAGALTTGVMVDMLGERFRHLIQLANDLGEAIWATRAAVGLERVPLTVDDPKPGDGPPWRDHPALDETVRRVEHMRKQKAVDAEAWRNVTTHLGLSHECGWKPVVEAIDARSGDLQRALDAEAKVKDLGLDFVEALDRLQGLVAGGGSPVDLKDPVPTNQQVDAVVEVVRDRIEALAAERDRFQKDAAAAAELWQAVTALLDRVGADPASSTMVDRIEGLARARDYAVSAREEARQLVERFQAELVEARGQRTRALVAEGRVDDLRTLVQDLLELPAMKGIGPFDPLPEEDIVPIVGRRLSELTEFARLVRNDLDLPFPSALDGPALGEVRVVLQTRLRDIRDLHRRLESLRSIAQEEVPEGGPPPAEPRGMTWRDRYQRLSSTHNAAARELYAAAEALGGEIPRTTTSILVGASRVRELAQLRAKDIEKGRITDPELPTDAKLAVAFLDFVAGVIASGGYRRSLDRAAIFAVDEGQVLRVEIDGLLGRVMRDDVDEETIQDLVTALAFLEAVDGEPDRYAPWAAAEPESEDPDLERRCRVCGCTDDDCRQCVEKTGEPCSWVEADLCSACRNEPIRIDRGVLPELPRAGEVYGPGQAISFGVDRGVGGGTVSLEVEALPGGGYRVLRSEFVPDRRPGGRIPTLPGAPACPAPGCLLAYGHPGLHDVERAEEEELEEPGDDPQVPIGATPRKFQVEGSAGGDPDAVAARVTAGIAEALRASSGGGSPVDEVPGASDPTTPR